MRYNTNTNTNGIFYFACTMMMDWTHYDTLHACLQMFASGIHFLGLPIHALNAA